MSVEKRIMKDKIRIALQDKRNGSLNAIYCRIRRYGTPFKIFDKRYKYSNGVDKPVVSRQLYLWRIHNGWTVDEALNTPAGKQGKKIDE